MKILVSRVDRFLQALIQKRVGLKAAAVRLSHSAGRWLNRTRRLERISSNDLRVAGAKLRTIPLPAAVHEGLHKHPVIVTSKALERLRADSKPLGIRSLEKGTLNLGSSVSADFKSRNCRGLQHRNGIR